MSPAIDVTLEGSEVNTWLAYLAKSISTFHFSQSGFAASCLVAEAFVRIAW
jgi:hypothetical protein